MKVLTKILLLLAMALPTAVLSSCSDHTYDDGREHDSQVVGNWQTIDHSYVYHFYEDGTYKCLTLSSTRAGFEYDFGAKGVWWTIRGRLNVLSDGGSVQTFNFKSGPSYLLLWPINGTEKDGFTLERLINFKP